MDFKLDETEKDLIIEMLESDSFKLLCEKILPAIVRQKEARALSLNIANESDLLALAIAKSKAEGAKDLSFDIASLKKLLITRRS